MTTLGRFKVKTTRWEPSAETFSISVKFDP
jgi:hypothetical protein